MSFSLKTPRWQVVDAASCLWTLAATQATAQVAPTGSVAASAGSAASPADPAGAPVGSAELAALVPPSDAERALARLRTAAPVARIAPRLATGLGLSLPGESSAARALAFVATYGEVFGLSSEDSLVERSTRGRTVRLEQLHAGLPVRNAGVTFAFGTDGRLSGYTNETQVVTQVQPAGLDEAGAARLVFATLGVPENGRTPVTRRTLVARGGLATVVYEIDLMVRPPLDVRRVLVDATAGRVIGQEKLVRP